MHERADSCGGDAMVRAGAFREVGGYDPELIAGEGSAISHYLVERENLQSFNVSTLHLRQGRDANVSSHSILLGGGLVRNNVHPVLGGEGAECLINGLYVGSQRQHLDNYMLVEHASPPNGDGSKEKDLGAGILCASGYVAGEGLAGVLIAGWAYYGNAGRVTLPPATTAELFGGLALLAVAAAVLYRAGRTRMNAAASR